MLDLIGWKQSGKWLAFDLNSHNSNVTETSLNSIPLDNQSQSKEICINNSCFSSFPYPEIVTKVMVIWLKQPIGKTWYFRFGSTQINMDAGWLDGWLVADITFLHFSKIKKEKWKMLRKCIVSFFVVVIVLITLSRFDCIICPVDSVSKIYWNTI